MESRILVLDGNQRAALAVTRSLGSKGLWVGVGESSDMSLAGSSRYCSRTMRYQDPFSSTQGFFNEILDIIKQYNITFLLPITEATAYVLLQYRDRLPPSVILPIPSNDRIEMLADKNHLQELARHLQIPTPDSLLCQNRADGLKALDACTVFPIVLKPFKSKILDDGEIISTSVAIAYTQEEARALLEKRRDFSYPFSIQSFIEGEGQGVFALYSNGQPVCFTAHRRLREKPPEGGVSVLCESHRVDETMQALSHKLLHAAQWNGVAMVEFKVAADGTPYLMEVNPRFWGSLQLAVDSGVDFPYLLYCTHTGLELPKVNYAPPKRVRWLLGDLDRLYLVLKAPRSRYSFSRKLLEIFRFISPNRHTRHEVNRSNDLRPFWFEIRQYLKALKSET
ncbi:carboxylate--amine ligase [Marinobacter sp. SS21]|uniref:carboxylate--amine ligase n=1 Tax=Marinobacter sp. SS21 TaxID=2979460 RepID=UPI00232ABDB5|nr:ATP-grasp domain-containing protein [Marinobacter sp. SS21]MDC0661948.1 ATP-grasp domain-containing protein [Marinobacter sp. SS21]